MKIEALEERRLLTATSTAEPHPYLEWLPDAVVKARDFLTSNPTLSGDVESWFAEEDAEEAASGIHVTLVELQVPHNIIPPEMSVELVEEMMEELIEDSTPVRDVVEVIFSFGSTPAVDARLATPAQAGNGTQLPAAARAASTDELAQTTLDLADQQPAEGEIIADPTIAVEKAPEDEETTDDDEPPAKDDGATTASFTEPVDPKTEAAKSTPSGDVVSSTDAALQTVPHPDERLSFIDHLRADLRAVDQSVDAMLDELQVLRSDLAEWLDEPTVPLWAKVALGSMATLAAWRELRRARERRAQPDEEAVDWIFLHSLDHEGAAS